jgi:hypothetical protein
MLASKAAYRPISSGTRGLTEMAARPGAPELQVFGDYHTAKESKCLAILAKRGTVVTTYGRDH